MRNIHSALTSPTTASSHLPPRHHHRLLGAAARRARVFFDKKVANAGSSPDQRSFLYSSRNSQPSSLIPFSMSSVRKPRTVTASKDSRFITHWEAVPDQAPNFNSFSDECLSLSFFSWTSPASMTCNIVNRASSNCMWVDLLRSVSFLETACRALLHRTQAPFFFVSAFTQLRGDDILLLIRKQVISVASRASTTFLIYCAMKSHFG